MVKKKPNSQESVKLVYLRLEKITAEEAKVIGSVIKYIEDFWRRRAEF